MESNTASPAPSTTSPMKLRNTVELLDSMAQQSFPRIEMIAEFALLAMERPGRPIDPLIESLAQAFLQIRDIAVETCDSIGSEAALVGGGWKDEAAERRYRARQAKRAPQTAEAN